jgi:hypothetical protein
MISTVLLTLFVIAIVLVLAGSFLSFKSNGNPQSSSRSKSSAYVTGTYRNGTRVYTQSSTTLTRGTATLKDTATLTRGASALKDTTTLTKTSVRLKSPAQGYRYELYREETLASRILPHLNIMQLIKPYPGKPTPYAGIVLIAVAFFGVGYMTLSPILNPAHTGQFFLLANLTSAPTPAVAQKPATSQGSSTTQSPFAGLPNVSTSLLRLNQMDQVQYNSTDEYNTWAASTCSAASMTEVINAYTHKNYRVTDILKVEAQLKQITPDEGLLQPEGIAITVAKFGFKADYLNNPTLESIEQIANHGQPVIISFPPSRWPGGHILILRGGQGDKVYLADSSVLNMQVMARDKFLSYWGGFAVVVTPK